MTDPLHEVLSGMWSAVTPAWGQHADFIDDRGAIVTKAMLEAADVRLGGRVLELACGPGGTGLEAAEIVGPGGNVVLSDFVREMTEIAAERADARGLVNVTTARIDMQDIDFGDKSFDTVLCREGLMLVIDPIVAVREARRVLVPGGRAVYAVWGPRERNPWLWLLLDAISSRLGIPIPPPGMPDPFALSGDGQLEELLSAAEFNDVAVREVSTPVAVSSFDEWWSIVPSLAGPVKAVLAGQPPEVVAEIRNKIETTFDQFRTQTGSFEIPGLSLVGAGQH